MSHKTGLDSLFPFSIPDALTFFFTVCPFFSPMLMLQMFEAGPSEFPCSPLTRGKHSLDCPGQLVLTHDRVCGTGTRVCNLIHSISLIS